MSRSESICRGGNDETPFVEPRSNDGRTVKRCAGAGATQPDFTFSKGSTCCPTIQAQALAERAQAVAKQAQDWAELSYYHAENVKLQADPASKGRVVFIGDAITEPWDLAKYFPGKPYLNRGIPGQTTPQMLVRFYPDVIDLHPAAVVILGGINTSRPTQVRKLPK